jgi:hypothetical protein
MGRYSESFKQELPGIAAFLRLAALAGFIIMLVMTDWDSSWLDLSEDSSGQVFRIAGISIFFASLTTFFEVLGDSKIKIKKIVLGILILVGGQFTPFLHAYTGGNISGAGAVPLIADFIALAWISILIRCLANKACKDT